MTRTVAALYDTREEAERVAAALKAQNLGGEVEVCDAEHDDAKRHHQGLRGWLSDIFGGNDDHHLYAEGVRRGHVLVSAKVDELNETRAASIMDAGAMKLDDVETSWRGEGWKPKIAGAEGQPQNHTSLNPLDNSSGSTATNPYETTFGGVRTYTL